ncbi:GNAT family protein [Dyella sp. ASV21]|uniref:GNAT family N-acetyltransferase n=1 Tax=Dyella sp. ASV21 TaxID=2795114 RepID=UPI0018EDEEF3|nr:GNAT family protein [Dyella sp. ASV21]
MELRTPRLRLDALHPADAAALFAYRADPVVARYQGWVPASLAEAAQFIDDLPAEPLPGRWFQWAIRVPEDGRLIGDLGVCLDGRRQATFGISLAPAQQGRGLAQEALQEVLGWLFGAMDVHRVHASVDPRNLASMGLLARLGLRQEALHRQSYWFCGEWADDAVFAMLVSEWRARVANGPVAACTR